MVIAGGRDYLLKSEDLAWLDLISIQNLVTKVVVGGCKGADAGGAAWARMRGIPVHIEPAEWDKYGQAAGPIRNVLMARMANILVAFPGGNGTGSMISAAMGNGLTIFEIEKLKRGTERPYYLVSAESDGRILGVVRTMQLAEAVRESFGGKTTLRMVSVDLLNALRCG